MLQRVEMILYQSSKLHSEGKALINTTTAITPKIFVMVTSALTLLKRKL